MITGDDTIHVGLSALLALVGWFAKDQLGQLRKSIAKLTDAVSELQTDVAAATTAIKYLTRED